MTRLMKSFLLLLVLAGVAHPARAGRILSAELMYKWLGGNNYELILKTSIAYKNIPPFPPSGVKGFFYSDCGHAKQRIFYTPMNGPLPQNIGGSGNNGDVLINNTICNYTPDPTYNSAVGIRSQHWYHAFVTLPVACSVWHFTANMDRIGGQGEVDSTQLLAPATIVRSNLQYSKNMQFFVEATLNNAAFSGNNSVFLTGGEIIPTFSSVGWSSLAPNNYVPGAIDRENDSLVFELMRPQDIKRTIPYDSSKGIDIPLRSWVTDYNRYPISVFRSGSSSPPPIPIDTFFIDPTTGEFKYNIRDNFYQFIAFRIKEYRNGVLVGTTMRDSRTDGFFFNYINFGAKAYYDTLNVHKTLLLSSVIGGIFATNRVEVCAGKPLSFALKVVSDSANAQLRLSDNAQYATPGGGFTYIGQGTDSVRANFSWTPTPIDTGLRQLIIRVIDTGCTLIASNFAGIRSYFDHQYISYAVPIRVYPSTTILQADTTFCAADSVKLRVIGGGNFSWSVLPGGSSTASLSCTACDSPVARPTVTTSYLVTSGVPSPLGCKTRDTVTITVLPRAQITPLRDTAFCGGGSVLLDLHLQQPASLFNIRWSPAAGLSDSTIPAPIAVPNAPTTYTVSIVPIGSTGACAVRDTVAVAVVGGSQFLSRDTALCLGGKVVIRATTDPRRQWRWTPGTALSDSTIINPTITPTTAGTVVYIVRGTYPGCPDSTIRLSVSAEPNPRIIAFPKDTALCTGDTLRLSPTVSPAFSGYDYRWILPAGSRVSSATALRPRFTAGPAGGEVFFVVSTPQAGCSAMDSFAFSLLPPAAVSVSPADTEICPGKTVVLTATGQRIRKVLWSPAASLSDTVGVRVTASPAGATIYTAIATTTDGCRDTATATVRLSDVSLYLPDTQVIYNGDTALLRPEPSTPTVGNYLWRPDVWINDATAREPFVWPRQSTLYTASVLLQSGCRATGQVFIKVLERAEIPVPNGFAPGVEIAWKIAQIGGYTLKSLRVYNRWGTLLFETTNANLGWDGTYGDTPQPQGVYVYVLEALTPTGKPYTQKGTITLVR